MTPPTAAFARSSEDVVSDTLDYAERRGLTFTSSSIRYLFKRHGHAGAHRHLDRLGAILDAAAIVGCDCTQSRAARRLALAKGDAQAVIDELAAQRRRRVDRRTAPCAVPISPPTLALRSNAYASCGCPHCMRRLANQLQRYIEKMISAPYFSRVDRDEARAEAYLELIDSAERWPGGPSFTGWFSISFERRIQALYRSRQRAQTVSLDAEWALTNDEGGRIVPLGERVPDRSIDVLTIVIIRELRAEQELARRAVRAMRSAEFELGRRLAS
jgi:DNA-directed RNA polymerase specialized sigma24 family protein